ncbi:MAG TPA: DUF3795 domain-containing protein, partial [Anaerolineae bacterium]|nr:DUF3795 domain-containing protein [Anaerolineae bacterium]
MVNKYIAYCGLYCKDCLRYNSDLINNAEDLKDEIIERHFQEYVDIKKASDNGFSKYPDFIDVLDKIIGLKCEKPCREGNGCSTLECKILSCCKTKGFEGCWECKSFESCSNFDFLKPFHGTTPQDNLRLIRDKGVRSIE